MKRSRCRRPALGAQRFLQCTVHVGLRAVPPESYNQSRDAPMTSDRLKSALFSDQNLSAEVSRGHWNCARISQRGAIEGRTYAIARVCRRLDPHLGPGNVRDDALAVSMNKGPTMKRKSAIRWRSAPLYQQGKLGYILAWLIGVPVPILVLVYLLRGCT